MKLDFSKLGTPRKSHAAAQHIIDDAECAGLVIGLDRSGQLVVGGRFDLLEQWWTQISANRVAIADILGTTQREMEDIIRRLMAQ